MKSRKLKNAMLLNVVLVGLIVWTQVILTLRPESAGGFEVMMIAWVGSFLVNNGFYFLANVGQKVLLSKFMSKKGEKDED